MTRPSLSFTAGVLAVVAVFLATQVHGQSPPRTPSGRSRSVGIYSNSDESGIPFERPARFEGRRNEDLTPQELETLRAERRKASAASSVAEDRPVDREVFWENLNAVNSRGWLVVDPPDGKIPPTTADAQQRAAARADARRRSGRGPADSAADRSMYRPLHHAGTAGLDDAGDATAARTRSCRDPTTWRSCTKWSTKPVSFRWTVVRTSERPFAPTWEIPTGMGGGYPGRRDDQLQGRDRLPERGRRDLAPDRALQGGWAERCGVVGHGERPFDVDAAMDLRDDADQEGCVAAPV